MNRVHKYGTMALTNAGVWQYLHGNKGAVRVGGMEIPVWGVGAALGLSTALVSDMAHNYILPHIAYSEKYNKVESAVLNPAVSAGAYLGASQIMNNNLVNAAGGATALAGIAVVTDVMSEYVYNQIVGPTLGDSSDF